MTVDVRSAQPQSEHYEVVLIQRGKLVITEITLPRELELDGASDRAREALLLHPPGTEVTVHRVTTTKLLHSRIDEHRQLHPVETPEPESLPEDASSA